MTAFVVFCGVLFKIQVVDGDKYAEEGSAISVRKLSVEGARGEILDRNGKPLITNRQGNAIVFDAALFPPTSEQEKRNLIVSNLIRLMEQNKVTWHDDLPIKMTKDGKGFKFAADADEEELRKMREDILGLNNYATAQNCMDAMTERFKLESYGLAERRKLCSVFYKLKRIEFNVSSPYTFADDVPMSVVAKIKENAAFFLGVDVEIVPYREYSDGSLMPHILGRVGVISAEEYEQAKEDGKDYPMNAVIGKEGIESAMEDYLHGTPGVKTVTSDSEGYVKSEYTVEPQQGDTVVLTIDSELQQVAKDAISNGLAALREGLVDPAGAIVIEDVNNGEILASYSYPGYDVSHFYEDYDELKDDKNAPLWNRAFLSTYSPGSTMKPCTATAALESKAIDRDTVFFCSRSYDYLGTHFQCLQPHASPYLNVVSALNESCNIFFYNVAQRISIDTLNSYAAIYGLGSKTGVELPEASGILDSPEYRGSLKQEWLPGFTLQNAIGNGGSMFSPIQLANYCATIANGGTRYRPHLVKTVKSADFSKTKLDNSAQITLETGISASTLETVREGMALVGSVGYCSQDFRGLPVKAAAKTGTSQVDRVINDVKVTTNNGFLITYAPAENPQIAICIAAEGAGSGSSLAPIAAAVYEYYFTKMGTYSEPQPEKELLK